MSNSEPRATAPSFGLDQDDVPTLDCASFHRHTSLCYGIDNWQGEL